MAPTKQQLNLLSKAAKAAQDGYQALAELQGFQTFAGASPSTSGVAAADFTDPATAGTFKGFDPAKFTAFLAAVQALVGAVQADKGAIAVAFAAMAEWQS